jgi:predicted  nucleic acid-binding Zn-ribbon protein
MMSEGLQQELTQKEELYTVLKNDYTRLELKYKELSIQKDGIEGNKGKQVKKLEDEIGYLKKHFEIEMGILKDENDILKKELAEVMTR